MFKPVRQKVIIATKSRTLSKGIRILLAFEEHLQVVSETKTAEELEKILKLFPLGIVLFDLPDPQRWIPYLKLRRPLCQFLLLDNLLDIKEADITYRNQGLLINSINKLALKPIPEIVPLEIQSERKFVQALQENKFSPQQKDTIKLVSWGKSNQEIAQILNLTERGIRLRLSHISSLLGAKKRTQIIAMAMRGGLVS